MLLIGRSTCVLLFLVLFTVQVSGFSCLEEWTITSSSSTLSQESPALDDDCPCHFTFVSSSSVRVYWNGLVTQAATRPPTTNASDTHFLLFRPPALA
jgi:hypothetical protein